MTRRKIKRLWTVVMYILNPLLHELSYDYLLIMTDKILNEQTQKFAQQYKLKIDNKLAGDSQTQ